ncbi:MAG TPA: PEP-utilizing enzyme [Candidatus Moranbacteria bacterium]|nr:PEP-utilizing enzyme [Candidatus Moranbacteria bacterium]
MHNNQLKEIINSIKNEKWHKRGTWNQNVLIHEICAEGEMTKFQKKIGHPFKKTKQFYYENDYFDLEKEWNALDKKICIEYKKDKNYLNKYAKDCLKRGEYVINFSKGYRKIRPKKLSNDDLSKKIIELIEEIKKYTPFMFSMHLVDEFLSRKFYELLNKYTKKNKLSKSEYFEYETALTLPARKIFALEERLDMLRIAIAAKKISEIDKKVLSKIKKHTQKYGWMSIPNFGNLPLEESFFLRKLKNIMKEDYKMEYDKIVNNEISLRKKQKELMKKIKDDGNFGLIAQAVQTFGFLRSFRVDTPFIAFHNAWDLVREITWRLGIKTIEIRDLSSREIKLALENRIDYKDLIKKRKNNLLGIAIADERYELFGEETDKVVPYINFPKDEVKGNIFKGQTAFPGIITGTAKVLNSPEEIIKVSKGDIIVVSMTDPNYIHAMEKASAFITEQGGILCHAAIISREMKKPCIIGTKIATKVLHDGDLVEVDADKGIVKILGKG